MDFFEREFPQKKTSSLGRSDELYSIERFRWKALIDEKFITVLIGVLKICRVCVCDVFSCQIGR